MILTQQQQMGETSLEAKWFIHACPVTLIYSGFKNESVIIYCIDGINEWNEDLNGSGRHTKSCG